MTTFDVPLAHRPAAWRWLADRLWRIEHAFERARAEGQEDAKIRIFFVTVLFGAAFLTLGAGATRSALFSDAAGGGGGASLTAGSRADLVDRNGQLLALDLPFYGLYVDRSAIWDLAETRRVLGPLVGPQGQVRLEKALKSKKRMQIMGPLSPQQRDAIADLGLPGVTFEPEARRAYPQGASAVHLIGYAGAGGVGLSGAELGLDKQIRQQAGHGPVPLSIDLRVQAALEDELQKASVRHAALGGVGIVTNVRTGEILGMASYPDAEPTKIESAGTARINRAANSVFEMGSIFKVFSVAIGLDSGVATLNTTFDARGTVNLAGQTIHDYHATNAVLTLSDVFLHSSNVGTTKLAFDVGAPTVQKYYKAFGLFSATPVELKESARPIAPTKWNDNTLASTSFGHAISVTPLMVAAGMGSILNGGTYVPLTISPRSEPPPGRRVVSEQTSRQMLDLMRLNATNGTGRSADAAAPGLRVGGKTGTAEKPIGGRYVRDKLVSSFAAVFPTDAGLNEDRYFVLILLDEPHSSTEAPGRPTGGIVGAPTAGRVINRIAPFLGVARTPETLAPPAAQVALAPSPPLDGNER